MRNTPDMFSPTTNGNDELIINLLTGVLINVRAGRTGSGVTDREAVEWQSESLVYSTKKEKDAERHAKLAVARKAGASARTREAAVGPSPSAPDTSSSSSVPTPQPSTETSVGPESWNRQCERVRQRRRHV